MILPPGIKAVSSNSLSVGVMRKLVKESELEYKKIFDNAMEGIFQIYPDGRLIKVNPALASILGYESPQQLLREIRGDEEKVYVKPNDRKKFLKIIKRKGSVSNFEFQIYRRDGRVIWVSESATTVGDEEGDSLYYEGFIQDITDQKLAEEERAQLLIEQAARIEAEEAQEKLLLEIKRRTQIEKKLRHSAKRFRALIEKSTEAITLVDKRGKNLYASPSTFQILGYNPKEFLKFKPFELVHSDDKEQTKELIKKLLSKPYESNRGYYRLKHKSGNWCWMEFIATNLLLEPSVKAIVINYHDVTKRIKLEQQKDEFLAIASHELKTPVTTIKAYAQLLQAQFNKKGQSGRFLEKINIQINNLTKLINELLDVTRIEEGKLLFRLAKFSLKNLVLQVIEDLQPTMPGHQIILQEMNDGQVLADRDRIGQVLINLISNAVKYSPGAGKVIVKGSKDKGFVQLSVTDFGIGIPKKYQAKIFDRFFRSIGYKKETFSGLGLGLYIAEKIVRSHGGKIWVKSLAGRGSTFFFKLPLAGGV